MENLAEISIIKAMPFINFRCRSFPLTTHALAALISLLLASNAHKDKLVLILKPKLRGRLKMGGLCSVFKTVITFSSIVAAKGSHRTS